MNMISDITTRIVEAGTRHIASLTFRKCKTLSSVTLPEGLLPIGDASWQELFLEIFRRVQLLPSGSHWVSF